jgi:MOSC domain-containing protein YiiM
VTGAEVGERWRVGPEADDTDVLLEVTSPRIPCMTFEKRMDLPGWVKRFTNAGMPGAYLRVVTPGTIGAGDVVRVESRPGHGVTVADLLANRRQAYVTLLAAEEAGMVELPPKLRRHAVRRTAAADRARV